MDGESAVKVTVASFVEPERHPHDDEVKDHVKQTWDKIKIDLASDDDEVQGQGGDDDADMGDQPEEAGDETRRRKEEEEEESGHGRSQCGEREISEREREMKLANIINEQREEVEKDEQEGEEIQGGEFNLRKFRMGKREDAVECPSWMSRIVFGSKILPTEPCMIEDAQPDLIKILLLQLGVNLSNLIKRFHWNILW